MKLKTMRWVDYWVGSAACFLLSLVHLFAKNSTQIRKSKKRPIRKILFIKLSEMGAISLACPLFYDIRKKYPEAEFFFLTFEKNRNFFELVGGIISPENIYTIREDKFGILALDSTKALRKIKKQNIDVVFDLEMMTRFSSILTHLSGIPKRIGFYAYTFEGLYRGNFLTHKVQYNPLLHISHSYLSLGKVLALDKKDSPEFLAALREEEIILPKYQSQIEKKNNLEKKLRTEGIDPQKPIFLMNPGEWDWPLNLREWPLENYIQLSRKIIEKNQENQIVIIGSVSLNQKSDIMKKSLGLNCFNLTGKTTIPELLELFYISKALIVNDCGLAHFSALTPIKKFVFFGPESPQIFGPLGENVHILHSKLPCSPCFSVFNHRNSACRNNNCLQRISVEDVFNLVMKNSE
jgi:ADP-heptose:LPS heptosyltransferase